MISTWVGEVLQRNNVPEAKVALVRQGIVQHIEPQFPRSKDRTVAPLRLAYFGRIDRAKGLDIVIQALQSNPAAAVRLAIFGVNQDAGNSEFDRVLALAGVDGRIEVHAAVAAERVQEEMSRLDLIVVPSRGLENAPLVVLEAFAAGVPVLGANLGGIAELVRDGIDGVLVAADDVGAWAEAIAGLSADRERIEKLRQGVRPPRTMRAVAAEMAVIYERLLTSAPRANA